ncbi:hypothetical protein EsVE80_07250 [Enterococcus saigonensis]|uniref:Uncharacterized protein n=1 Tax=Enterococcus saigonensis TaxID=1805431 RepID=A0A679IGZ0_9ENTE|nr:hypothetical protein EsVE80_07250 [Enterococcus saigonensis]
MVAYKAVAVIQSVETSSDVAWAIKMVVSRIIGAGVAQQRELDSDNLENNLKLEMCNSDNDFIREMNFGTCGVNKLEHEHY